MMSSVALLEMEDPVFQLLELYRLEAKSPDIFVSVASNLTILY